MAPFMPVLSQHLHQSLPSYEGDKNSLEYPTVSHFITITAKEKRFLLQQLEWKDDSLEKNVEEMMDIVVTLRRLKSIFNVTRKSKPKGNKIFF